MTNSKCRFTILISLVSAIVAGCGTEPPISKSISAAPQVLSVKKIWDEGGHNAFTDLICFKGQWFCTFRESAGHLVGNGKIRIIVSQDGDKWESAALLSEDGVDLRDPKLSIAADGRLMLVVGGTVHEGATVIERQPRVAFSKDAREWTNFERVLSKDDWLWRVTWHEGRAYGVVYNSGKGASTIPGEWSARFVESNDGVHYQTLAQLDVPNRPNEATARFLKNGDCLVLIRREAGDKSAWIGISSTPYQDWKWQSAGLFVGGPNFILLDDGRLIAGGREMLPPPTGARMFIGGMERDAVTPRIVLPSGGDCSYPGLVWRDGVLWVTYYSSHEGKTSIYLAKIKI